MFIIIITIIIIIIIIIIINRSRPELMFMYRMNKNSSLSLSPSYSKLFLNFDQFEPRCSDKVFLTKINASYLSSARSVRQVMAEFFLFLIWPKREARRP